MVLQIENTRRIQQSLGVCKELVTLSFIIISRIPDEAVDQHSHACLISDVMERIIAVRMLHVRNVENLDFVAMIHERLANRGDDLS